MKIESRSLPSGMKEPLWAILPAVSETNLDLVRTAAEALNRGTDEEFLALADPSIEIVSRLAAGLGDGTYRGHDGVRAYLAELRESWAEFAWEPEEFVEFGEHVVVPVCFRAVGQASGAPTEVRVTCLVQCSGGLITRLVAYGDRSAALAAIGMQG